MSINTNDFYYRVNDRDARLKSITLTIPDVSKITDFVSKTEVNLMLSLQDYKKVSEKFRGTIEECQAAFVTDEYGRVTDKLLPIFEEFQKNVWVDLILSVFNDISGMLDNKGHCLTEIYQKHGISLREKLCDDATTELNNQMGILYQRMAVYERSNESDNMEKELQKKYGDDYDYRRKERDIVIPAARRGVYDK